MAPRKSTPKGIDPAYPNRNFVRMCAENRGDDGYLDMYGGPFSPSSDVHTGPKSSGYGHAIGQRAGKLRLSGMKNAHRIGKRNR